MKIATIHLLVTVFVFSAVTSVDADTLSGKILLDTCTDKSSTNPAICSAYFLGFADGLVMQTAANKAGRPICIPDGPMAEELKLAFLKFARTHRQMLNGSADALVGTAAALSFRCKH